MACSIYTSSTADFSTQIFYQGDYPARCLAAMHLIRRTNASSYLKHNSR
jgi:hypothetical protein